MKKLLTLIVFALITSFAVAQNNYQDVVYLKNGSIIRGVIIEQVPNESIKIETSDRSVFIYTIDEIDKMTKEIIPGSNDSAGHSNGNGLKPGHRGIIETGYHFGVGNYAIDRLKLNVINGGQFNPYFFLGGGLGLRYYFDSDAAIVPVFVHARANFIDSKVSPYAALSIGYSFNATNDFDSLGFLLSPSIGVTFIVSQKVNLNAGLSYEMQNENNGYNYGNINLGGLGLEFGLSF